MGKSSKSRSLGWLALVTLLCAASYLAWLGWDQEKTRVPGTFEFEGPYEPWQVVGLAFTLAAITAVTAWRSSALGWTAVVTITVVLTSAFSIDAATERTQDANLWPIGAFMLAVGTFGACPSSRPSWRAYEFAPNADPGTTDRAARGR